MASNTKASENRRLRKKNRAGHLRKSALEKKGTTRSELQLFGNVLKP